MGDLTNDFSRSEFMCKCGCGRDNISMELVTKLQRLRTTYNGPITINAGCRCVQHNTDVGGVPDSAHICEGKDGEATDIKVVSSAQMFALLDIMFFYKLFNRIEVDQVHIHVDVSKVLPQSIFDVRPIHGGK